VEVTDKLPEDLKKADIRGFNTGELAQFERTDGTNVVFNGAVCLDVENGYYYWYVADLAALVTYKDEAFSLSQFHIDASFT
jgi:hypothetical protein